MTKSINPSGLFRISSVKINSKHFASTVNLLVSILGLKIKRLVHGSNGQRSVHLTTDYETNSFFELIVTDDLEAVEKTPIQIGVQSVVCNLPDTLRILDLIGLQTQSVDEANLQPDAGYPTFIPFKDPAFATFYLEIRPLIDMNELEYFNSGHSSESSISTNDYLALLGIHSSIEMDPLRTTSIDAFNFEYADLASCSKFFAALGMEVDADNHDG